MAIHDAQARRARSAMSLEQNGSLALLALRRPSNKQVLSRHGGSTRNSKRQADWRICYSRGLPHSLIPCGLRKSATSDCDKTGTWASGDPLGMRFLPVGTFGIRCAAPTDRCKFPDGASSSKLILSITCPPKTTATLRSEHESRACSKSKNHLE